MSNPDYNDDPNKRKDSAKPPKLSTPAPNSTLNEKNVNWPGLIGKAQPKSRDGGVKKTKIYPTSVGI